MVSLAAYQISVNLKVLQLNAEHILLAQQCAGIVQLLHQFVIEHILQPIKSVGGSDLTRRQRPCRPVGPAGTRDRSCAAGWPNSHRPTLDTFKLASLSIPRKNDEVGN